MSAFEAVRVTELPNYGDWPWRFIVEGRRAPFWRKKWPWSKPYLVADEWVQLSHGVFGHGALQASDARALARQYEAPTQHKESPHV